MRAHPNGKIPCVPPLNIDDDLLNAVKQEALARNATVSVVAADLIRAGLRSGAGAAVRPAGTIGRFAILPPRDEIITPEHVRKLME